MILKEKNHPSGQQFFGIVNGLQLSLICTPTSYGGRQGLWELAVWIDGQDNVWKMPRMPHGIEGWLSFEDAEKLVLGFARLNLPKTLKAIQMMNRPNVKHRVHKKWERTMAKLTKRIAL